MCEVNGELKMENGMGNLGFCALRLCFAIVLRASCFVFCLGLLASCQQKGGDASKAAKEAHVEAPTRPLDQLPELSIYNLPAKWHTQHDEEIELVGLRGKILVMVMIYTSCKAACPRLVADMRAIESQVPEAIKSHVKYLLVSIDPEVDTPKRLASFARANKMDGEEWLFLQGTPEQVREFAAVLAVSYKKISPIDFSHSNIISVFDEHGVLKHQKEGLGVNNKETVAKIIELAETLTLHTK